MALTTSARSRVGDGVMAAGAILLLVATILPWYRVRGGDAAERFLLAAGRSIGPHGTAWQSFTGVKLLLVALILLALAASLLGALGRNRVLSVAASAAVFLLGTLTSVLLLDKIAIPPGGPFVAPAVGAYAGLAAGIVITLGASLRIEPVLRPAATAARRWEPNAATYAALLAGITALACLLRLPTLGSQSFWGDELFTLWHVRASLGDLVSQVSDSPHPYLYFLLAKGWTAVFGTGEAGLRSLSTLAGVATVPVSALVARELFSPKTALLTALLVATNPLLVWYSQEARPYALLALFCALGLLFFVRAVRDLRPREVALWAAFSSLALLTHYFAAFSVLPQAVWLLVLGRRRASVPLVPVLAAVPLAVALALAPLVNHQRSVPNIAGLEGVPVALRASQVVREFLFGPPQPCLPPYGRPCALATSTLMIAVLCVIVALLAWLLTRLPRDQPGVRLAGLLFLCSVVVPVALAVAGIDFLTVRNTIPGVVPLALLVAAGALATRASVMAAVLLVALGVSSVVAVWSRTDFQRPKFDGPAKAAGPPTGDRLVVTTPGMGAGPFGVLWPDSTLLGRRESARVDELVVSGVSRFFVPAPPSVPSLKLPPGFRLAERVRGSDYVMLRYRSSVPRSVSWEQASLLGLRPGVSSAVYLQEGPSG